MGGQPKRRSARLLRACCSAAVAGCFLPAALDDIVAFASLAFGRPTSRSAPFTPDTQQQWSRQPIAARRVFGPEVQEAAAQVQSANAAGLFDSSLLTSFSDQAGNINGALFQGSLPAYLLFLYFLGYRGNNTPPMVLFGFSFLLTFVLSTIPSGIISKSTYGVILADSDWIHGTAESLLTCTNIMIVLGFRGALTGDKDMADGGVIKNVAFVWLATVVLTLASGIPLFGFETHTPFLAGLGALSSDAAEPVNALSIPNWMVHWSTVFEFLIAMSLAWRYADATGNSKWKGLTWGMFPSSCSSVCALSFHLFYNQIPWILTAQAFFTFVGNCTLALAAYRIATSNGWTVAELDPRPALGKLFGGEKSGDGEVEEKGFDLGKVTAVPSDELVPGPLLAAEVVLLTVAFAYGTKYGELAVGSGIWQSPESSPAAILVILLQVSLVAYTIYSNSPDLKKGQLPAFALQGSADAAPAPQK